MQKTAPENSKYSRNDTILNIGHHGKAIAHRKWSISVKNSISKKHVKILSRNHLELFGSKIKLPGRCERWLYRHTAVVLCKKGSKKQLIFEKWDDFKNCARSIAFAKWWHWERLFKLFWFLLLAFGWKLIRNTNPFAHAQQTSPLHFPYLWNMCRPFLAFVVCWQKSLRHIIMTTFWPFCQRPEMGYCCFFLLLSTGIVLGPVAQMPINTNPRLRVNQAVYFSPSRRCSTLIFGKTLH